MAEQAPEVVRHEMMVNRTVDPDRYSGLVRPDKTIRFAADELREIEKMRRRSPGAWPTPTALPESLHRLAGFLHELGWDDLTALARREEVAVYRRLETARPGTFSGEIDRALGELCVDLVMRLERFGEALEVVDEQLRRSQGKRSDALFWRTRILALLGRNQEALEAAEAAVAVERSRVGLARAGSSARLDLTHALTNYADRLDAVGRVSEAADVTADVVAHWYKAFDGTVEFLSEVNRRSERLVRCGRTDDARTCITDAMRTMRRRKSSPDSADTWLELGTRLLSLGLADEALAATEYSVQGYRGFVSASRAWEVKVEAREDWDDSIRYSEYDLLLRRRKELESVRAAVRKCERSLHDGLLALSSCLRQLHRIGEAKAARAEAAVIARAHRKVARSGDRTRQLDLVNRWLERLTYHDPK